jgi:hypothetical protein
MKRFGRKSDPMIVGLKTGELAWDMNAGGE